MTDVTTAVDQSAADPSGPLYLELGGTTYKLSPLNGSDISEMDTWVRSRIMRMAFDALSPDMPEDVRSLTIQSALKTAIVTSFMSGLGREIVANIDGVSQLIWISLRRNHKGLTVADVRNLLTKPGAIDTAMNAFASQNPQLLER